MPTNLYGPNDNYDLNNSHVLPALLRKFHTAKITNAPTVEVWGTGSPLREFLHVDDLADACFYLMQNYDEEQLVNVGSGTDISIKNLALLIKEIVGYNGELVFNSSKPDGTPRKLMDVTKLEKVGWTYKITLEEGIRKVYDDILKNNLFD
jgi:GDP-L-fucose synthase